MSPGHFYLAGQSSRVQAVVIREGVLQYSPGQGYTGRASRVIIQQSHSQQELNRDSSRLQWAVSVKVVVSTKQQTKERQREEIKTPMSEWKFVLSLSLIMVLGMFLFFCFKRR